MRWGGGGGGSSKCDKEFISHRKLDLNYNFYKIVHFFSKLKLIFFHMTQIFMREMEGGVQAKCEKGGGGV